MVIVCMPVKNCCFSPLYSCESCEYKPQWLSELGILHACTLSGSLKNWALNMQSQSFDPQRAVVGNFLPNVPHYFGGDVYVESVSQPFLPILMWILLFKKIFYFLKHILFKKFIF